MGVRRVSVVFVECAKGGQPEMAASQLKTVNNLLLHLNQHFHLIVFLHVLIQPMLHCLAERRQLFMFISTLTPPPLFAEKRDSKGGLASAEYRGMPEN